LNNTSMTINSWSASSINITIPTGATSGLLKVSAAPSMNDSNPIHFAVTTHPLPSGWLNQDVGSVGVIGSATYAAGVFSMQGGGYGVGGTSYGYGGSTDEFHFIYRPVSGDTTIVARVVSGPTSSGQAGVLIRETLDTAALNAFTTDFPQNGFFMQSVRSVVGGNESNIGNSSGQSLPYWVKLARSGNSFSSYISADGSNWSQVGATEIISMNTNVMVGLAGSGHSNTTLASVTFDNVSVTSYNSSAPQITGVSATTGSIGSQVIISGSGFGNSQGSSQVLLNDSPTTINTWSDGSITITIPTGATSGPLVVSLAPSLNDSNAYQFTVTSNPLPSGWLDQDVGTVGVGGSGSYLTGVFSVQGAGLGVGGTTTGFGGPQDSFHFVYKPVSGNGTLIARIVTEPGTTGQAGIMIRQDLSTTSLNAFDSYFPQDGCLFYFSRATTTSNEFADGCTTGVSLAYWTKLVRNNSTFTAYVSSNGSTWTQLGAAQTIPMGQNVYVGLGVTSHSTTSTATATFDNVSASFSPLSGAPTIGSLSKTAASYGTSITITGTNFGLSKGTSTVSFNGTLGTPTAWGSTSIQVPVPTGATTGPLVVTVSNIASNAVSFGVFNPNISSVAPPEAEQFASVTLNGSGFGTSQGSSMVQFNGVSATPSAWSPTSITATVPGSATTGPLTVTVGGVASNSISFTVKNLSVTGISPNIGLAGTHVTISGTGFGLNQSTSTVDFYGTAASIFSWSDQSIVAIVPAGAPSGSVDVTVGNVTVYGPQFTLTQQVQLTDSMSHSSTYTTALIGGQWRSLQGQGSGCSSCTQRGNVSYTYDSAGHPLSRTDENGHATTYTYDSYGNVLTVTAPISSTLSATTTYTYNSFGEVLTATDPLGKVTTRTYDPSGNLLTVTTPVPSAGVSASVTQFAYNALGELTSITDPLNNVTALTYTAAGLVHTITDAQTNVTTYAYDSRGNRTSVTDAQSNVTSFTYDSMNRLTKITYPDTTTTQFAYDYRGRRTTVTDQNNKVTTYAYDDADRLITVTDAATNVTTYGYDTESNLTSIKDANNHTTSFTLDAYGRVTQTNFPNSQVEMYGYDNVGNLTSKTDRNNHQITYTYDQLNRLTTKTYPDTTTVNYTFDLDSRLTQVTDPTGTYTFTFDNMGRLSGTTTQYAFLTGRSFTTSYGYDAASNRTGFTDPENGSASYVYDTLNRLQTLTPPTAYGTGSFGFGYDALSRRTSLTRPNSVGTSYSYDTLSRLLSVTHAKSGTTLDGASYTVDNAGNRLTRTPLPTGMASTFGYDNIYELLSVTKSGSTTESYTYDPVGNRLTNLGSSSWSYNTANELSARPSYSYTYDLNGNTQTSVGSAGTTTYNWDYENRLTSVVLPGSGGTVSFKYDPFGRRIYKSSISATSIYAYDGDNLVEETNAAGSAVARYSQGLNIDEPLAMLRSGTTSYYQADGLGSLTSLSNTSGALANTYTYDSFGNVTASTGSLTNSFRYTGREFDSETSLYYYRARYYDPAAGRFLSEDPINFKAGVNFYLYVYNRPTRLRDPRGKDPVIGATVGAIIGGIYGGIGAAADDSASLGDILSGIGVGLVTGGVIGALDPTLGLGATIAITAGGDLAGQLITGHGPWNKCKPINVGSVLGSAVGGAIGFYGGGLFSGLGEGWIATGAKTAFTGVPGALTPGIGAHLLPPSIPSGCGCER
jgi:RHS repeat-associated protein